MIMTLMKNLMSKFFLFNKIRINDEISKAILKMHQEEEKNTKEKDYFQIENNISNSFIQKDKYDKTFLQETNNLSNSSTESNSSIKSNISYQNNLPANYNYEVFNFSLFNNANLNKNNYLTHLFSANTFNINFPFVFPIISNNCNNNFYNQRRNLNNFQYNNNNKFEPKKKHKNLDMQRNKIHLENILRQKEKRTTLMIRHIPNKYSIKLLVEELDINFKNKYDLIYLPIDIVNCCNLGFGFINFTHIFHILNFYDNYNGKKWKKFNSDKKCELVYSKIQGKNELFKSIKMNENYNNAKNIPIHYLNNNIVKDTPVTLPLKYLQAFLNFYPYASYNVINSQSFVINSLYNF